MKNILTLTITFVFLAACKSHNYKPVHIAVIKDEVLNTRLGSSPAPYEKLVAEQSLNRELKPLIHFYSRNRAIEIFQNGLVDIVVSGQASSFGEDLKSSSRIIEGSKAVLFYKDANYNFGKIEEFPKGIKVGIMRDSAFGKHFAKRVGDIQIVYLNSPDKAAKALSEKLIDCLVIDEIAKEHFQSISKNSKVRKLDLPSEPVYWLYR